MLLGQEGMEDDGMVEGVVREKEMRTVEWHIKQKYGEIEQESGVFVSVGGGTI